MAKNHRLYSLFARPRGTRGWVRISRLSFPKNTAVRVFQNKLLRLSLTTPYEPALRVVAGHVDDLSPAAEAIRQEVGV